MPRQPIFAGGALYVNISYNGNDLIVTDTVGTRVKLWLNDKYLEIPYVLVGNELIIAMFHCGEDWPVRALLFAFECTNEGWKWAQPAFSCDTIEEANMSGLQLLKFMGELGEHHID